MSTPVLDEKLHDLLYEQAGSYYFEGSNPEWFEQECPDLIGKFKQAFVDDGWVQIPNAYQAGTPPKIYNQRGKELLTGEQWLTRFEAELDKEIAPELCDPRNLAIEVARRASGIEEMAE